MIETTGQFAIFTLGGEEFALGVGRIVEILQYQESMPLPNLPDFLTGVIELRGRVIPVMDLRTRFGLKKADKTKERIIVLRKGRERLAALVDDVNEIVALSEAHMSPPPSIFKGIGAMYMEGIARLGKRMIVVLNVDRLLTTGEMDQMKEALKGGRS